MPEIGIPMEVKDIKKLQGDNEFKQIRPEEGTSFQEAKDFWDHLFDEGEGVAQKEIKENWETFDDVEKMDLQNPDEQDYYDDNGKLYRSGNELMPNNEYEINGYQYKTGENGANL